MKCEEINYRKCKSKVGVYDITMDSKGNSSLRITDLSGAGSALRNSIFLEKKVAKQVLLEALAIVEELE